MHFAVTSEQYALADALENVLADVCDPRSLRRTNSAAEFDNSTRLAALRDIGIADMLLPETAGGMGCNECDFVLIAQRCGRYALPEPLVEIAGVCVPALAASGSKSLLEAAQALVRGSANTACKIPQREWLTPAFMSGDVLMVDEHGVLTRQRGTHVERSSVGVADPLVGLARLGKEDERPETIDGVDGAALANGVFERGALFAAAQLIGLAQGVLEQAREYALVRKQFGQPIGAFQAVKHKLADLVVAIEFAKPVVIRASWAIAHSQRNAALAVSHAKLAASRAALQAAEGAIHVFGAMGYTEETDLHLWTQRIWLLAGDWGTTAFHRSRVHAALQDRTALGAGTTF